MMALLKYFKCSTPFPSHEGPLSMKVALSSIQAANNKVEEALSQEYSTTAGYTAAEKV